MVKDKALKNLIFCLVILILTMFFSGFFVAKRVYAAETETEGYIEASQVLKALGVPENQLFLYQNQHLKDYHLVIVNSSENRIYHAFSDIPFLIQNDYYDNGRYAGFSATVQEFYLSTGNRIQTYSTSFKFGYVAGDTAGFVDRFNSLNWNETLKYSSHNVLVSGNGLEDVGWNDGEIFFFKGNYLPGGNPIENPDEPQEPGSGGINDEDKSWFSGLFGGITESLGVFKDNIIDGITEAFSNIGNFILDGIRDLFVPDEEFLNEKIDSVKEKFAFIDSIKSSFDTVSGLVTDGTEKVPQMTIDFSLAEGKYDYGGTALALDMTWYTRFKPYADGIIIAFSYISFIFLLFKRAPEIISGSGAITDKNDDVQRGFRLKK